MLHYVLHYLHKEQPKKWIVTIFPVVCCCVWLSTSSSFTLGFLFSFFLLQFQTIWLEFLLPSWRFVSSDRRMPPFNWFLQFPQWHHSSLVAISCCRPFGGPFEFFLCLTKRIAKYFDLVLQEKKNIRSGWYSFYPICKFVVFSLALARIWWMHSGMFPWLYFSYFPTTRIRIKWNFNKILGQLPWAANVFTYSTRQWNSIAHTCRRRFYWQINCHLSFKRHDWRHQDWNVISSPWNPWQSYTKSLVEFLRLWRDETFLITRNSKHNLHELSTLMNQQQAKQSNWLNVLCTQ